MGTSLKKEDRSLELDVYVSGLRDAVSGNPPKVIDDQHVKANKNRAISAAFLAAYGELDGVTTLASGLHYRVLVEGTGNRPDEDGTVSVTYRTKLIDGTVLSSSSGKPVDVDLHRVISGWKEAIPLMKEGAKWELVVPPQLAYGARGSTGIAPESTLVFEVELLKAKAEQRTN